VADVETIVVTSSKEALLLENHLIKKHQPRFNVKLRDDKQYWCCGSSIPRHRNQVTQASQTRGIPRVEVVRNIRDDNANYFGPTTRRPRAARPCARSTATSSSGPAPTTCSRPAAGRACSTDQALLGPCAFEGTAAAYAEQVEDVKMFLSGKNAELLTRLRSRMEARSDRETTRSPRCCATRSKRSSARWPSSTSSRTSSSIRTCGHVREADVAEVGCCSCARQAGRPPRVPAEGPELPDATVIAEHLQQYYATGTFIPTRSSSGRSRGRRAARDWLSSVRGRRVKSSSLAGTRAR